MAWILDGLKTFLTRQRVGGWKTGEAEERLLQTCPQERCPILRYEVLENLEAPRITAAAGTGRHTRD